MALPQENPSKQLLHQFRFEHYHIQSDSEMYVYNAIVIYFLDIIPISKTSHADRYT